MIKISYLNFWVDPHNDRYFSKFISENLKVDVSHVNPTDNPDILFASVFGNINNVVKVKSKCKIFFYGENLERYPPYNNIGLLKNTFDLIIGFKNADDDKILRFPLWLIYYDYYNFENEDNVITYIEKKHAENIRKNKEYFSTIVCRHDRGGQRTKIMQQMDKYGKILCGGTFNNNHKIGNSLKDKLDFISKGIYHICPENSMFEGYTTEKIFHAFECGTIPVYWGHDLPEKNIINENKYCFCNLDNEIILQDQINYCIKNKEKYIYGEIFKKDSRNIIDGYYKDLMNKIKYILNNKKFSLCFIILTCQKNLYTKVKWQKEFMFEILDDVYYISSVSDLDKKIYGWDTVDDYNSPPIKYINFFKNMNLKYDYYFFIDDDTFVNIKNLKNFIDNISLLSYKKIFAGFSRHFVENKTDKIKTLNDLYIETNELTVSKGLSGGAGFLINNCLYNEIRNFILFNNENILLKMSEDKGKYYSDIFIGSIVKKIKNVNTIVSKKFHMGKHIYKDELKDFITFHYVDSKELFKFYSEHAQ